MNELKDLQVERVDGVDRPATGRKFVIFKNEDGAQSVMKGFALTATAAAEVLKAVRKDAGAKLSKSAQVALNGLAQVLGQDAVYKAVPTQPYEYSEPDVDKRGPADEKIPSLFTPGSMVGKSELTLKAAAKAAAADCAEPDADDAADDDKKKMPWMKSIEGLVEAVKSQGDQIAALTTTIKGVIEPEKTEKTEKVAKSAPKSRQVDADDEPVERVQKSEDLRMGVSFANIAFGK
jgi:hypothetical protein